jgi:hypothetical protein
VVKPGKTFEALAKNQLQEQIFATPAVVDGSLFLRTAAAIYRIDGNSRP